MLKKYDYCINTGLYVFFKSSSSIYRSYTEVAIEDEGLFNYGLFSEMLWCGNPFFTAPNKLPFTT